MSKAFKIMLTTGLAAMLSMPLAAHHSTSTEYDTSKPVTFTGKVVKVDWRNPHIYTHIEARDEAGALVVFHVEGGTPNSLYRLGWRPDTLKAGDTVSVSGWRSRNPASTNVGMATIKGADGKVIFITPGRNAIEEATK